MAYRATKKHEKKETIILAFDIGTTHSAVSFSYAYPGEFPDVRSVVKWPGQPEASGDSKIPTIVAYQGGEAKEFGAEAREHLDNDEYEIARWFKLHLHPESMKSRQFSTGLEELEIPPLPLGVTLSQLYADFIRYIYKETKEFFVNNTPNGQFVWSRLEGRMPIIFCTPNGWDMSEHAFLRKAAIRAGIVTDSAANDRLLFITEGEASVHYSLAHTKTAEWLKEGTIFAVTDAGGSTVDSTLYRCRRERPLVLEEVCASACVQAGGVYVDRAMEDILRHKLVNSTYSDAETISLMARQFEQKTKRVFDGSQESNLIHFGSPRDNDKDHGIVKGKLTLSRDEVSAGYVKVISSITDSCKGLLENRNVQHLLLVGGFGESPYLRNQLKNIFGGRGTQIVTIDEPSKKAAADGAVIWYLTQLVEARAARFDYGVVNGEDFDIKHHGRYKDKCFQVDNGGLGFWTFKVLIPKGTIFTEQWFITLDRHANFPNEPTPKALGKMSEDVLVWQGNGPHPYALEPFAAAPLSGVVPIPGLDVLFTVRADLQALYGSVRSHRNPNTGRPYWRLSYHLDLHYSGMQLSARLRWKEKGVERIGPATIVPVTKL